MPTCTCATPKDFFLDFVAKLRDNYSCGPTEIAKQSLVNQDEASQHGRVSKLDSGLLYAIKPKTLLG